MATEAELHFEAPVEAGLQLAREKSRFVTERAELRVALKFPNI
jgi:hypothetical protein